MTEDTNLMNEKIKKLEEKMTKSDFWADKVQAQAVLKELAELKAQKGSLGKYDKGNAIISIISGAGGDDAEDFSHMLLDMYVKYASKKGWKSSFVHEHKNNHNGYKNVSFEIEGVNTYGALKNESGVHRLVRVSPFNAKKLRHTSFSLVEVLPKFSKLEEKKLLGQTADSYELAMIYGKLLHKFQLYHENK